MHYVYILRSKNHPSRLYTGHTRDIKERIAHHNNGSSPHTSKYKLWGIVHLSTSTDEQKARGFEKYLKTASGKAFRNKRLICPSYSSVITGNSGPNKDVMMNATAGAVNQKL
ncbi:MAG: GIY-YIG nuclease family protein [Candidatus Gracilibacteria bacterium]|nr:GIY-YIG nuclease family protein [Candidatus Gracilibacteria bacterium]